MEKLRILDPACGSGSFLIGAYQYLIDWHLNYYRQHPKEARGQSMYSEVEKNSDGTLRLSFRAKSRILTHNLYGVDLDPQAVEITMMSLYLKALEGEQHMLGPKHERLPELKYNIICGNSLIGRRIHEKFELTPEQHSRIRPFDWHSRDEGFGDILKDGGFDAIIGNPPYGADYDSTEKEFFQSEFSYKKGKPETYIFFMERGIGLLKEFGRLGFITPNAWLTNHYGIQIRKYVLEGSVLETLVDLEPTKVFEGAVVDTAVTILSKRRSVGSETGTQVLRGTSDRKIVWRFEANQSIWAKDENLIINLQANPTEVALLRGTEEGRATLESVVEFSQGVIPYKTKEEGEANKYISASKGKGNWFPLIESASQVKRYYLGQPKAFIKYGPWLWCEREFKYFSQPKILFHRLRKKLPVQLVAAMDISGAINRHALSNLILRPELPSDMLLAVLGLFNSRLVNWWFAKRFGLLMEVGGFKVNRIPLPETWSEKYRILVPMVSSMNELRGKSELGVKANESSVQRSIVELEQEINSAVYDLFQIERKEKQIIEETSHNHDT